jgi:GAF domain-containing protein
MPRNDRIKPSDPTAGELRRASGSTLLASANRRLAERCAALEAGLQRMTTLWVASARLHCSVDPAEAMDNIKDIIVTLVGSEEIAIWRLDRDGKNLLLQASQGIDGKRWARVPARKGVFNQVVTRGQIFLRGKPASSTRRAHDAHGLTACIPLRAGGLCTGAIGIFDLLPHKPGISTVDRALFDLLANQAAIVLICAGRSARRAAYWGRRDG